MVFISVMFGSNRTRVTFGASGTKTNTRSSRRNDSTRNAIKKMVSMLSLAHTFEVNCYISNWVF